MIRHFTPYSQVLKDSILQKILSEDKPVSEMVKEHGVSKGVVYYWLRREREKAGQSMNKSQKKGSKPSTPPQWSVAEKLNAIKATAGLSPEAAASWCREHGIYMHVIEQWEQEFLLGSATESSRDSEYRREIAELRAINKQLNQDLTRKEKALAETTARLVLKKNWRSFLGRTRRHDLHGDERVYHFSVCRGGIQWLSKTYRMRRLGSQHSDASALDRL